MFIFRPKIKRSIMKLKIPRFVMLAVDILLCWFLGHTSYIVIDGMTDNGSQTDIAVILGTTVHEDGTLSNRLEKRLMCGLQLFKSGRTGKIIVSGGLGKEGFREGDKMKEFLLLNGVPDSCIVVDNHGNNTEMTVMNTLRLREQLKFESITVVSQFFHVTRTKMLLRSISLRMLLPLVPGILS